MKGKILWERTELMKKLTWIGSSDGWGIAKGWTINAKSMLDVAKRSTEQGIYKEET